MAGGPGTDAVTYAGGPAVVVTLDDLANDGPPGEHDNVQTDIEDVYGSDGPDTLIGSAAANVLDGGAGDDTIAGAGGRDNLYGGPGDDRIDARDGLPDRIDCGDGFDSAIVDERDHTTGCEVVDRRPAVPRVDFLIAYEWAVNGPFTTATRLSLHELQPARAAVTVRCAGPGCPRALRRPVTSRRANLLPLLRDSRLRAGSVVAITAARAGYITRVARFRIQDGTGPTLKIRCTAAGATTGSRRLGPCPRSG
jgi:hypothetical protein